MITVNESRRAWRALLETIRPFHKHSRIRSGTHRRKTDKRPPEPNEDRTDTEQICHCRLTDAAIPGVAIKYIQKPSRLGLSPNELGIHLYPNKIWG